MAERQILMAGAEPVAVGSMIAVADSGGQRRRYVVLAVEDTQSSTGTSLRRLTLAEPPSR
jgi:hypothetical protein